MSDGRGFLEGRRGQFGIIGVLTTKQPSQSLMKVISVLNHLDNSQSSRNVFSVPKFPFIHKVFAESSVVEVILKKQMVLLESIPGTRILPV